MKIQIYQKEICKMQILNTNSLNGNNKQTQKIDNLHARLKKYN